jgi:hypothetical protein
LIKTEQYGPEQMFQRSAAATPVRYCEDPNVHGIVAHGPAKDLNCGMKMG